MLTVSSGRAQEMFPLVVCLAVVGVGIGVGMEGCLAVEVGDGGWGGYGELSCCGGGARKGRVALPSRL